MTSPIGPIAPITAATPAVAPITTDLSGATAADGESFATKLSQGLEWVQGLQNTTDQLRLQAATGTLTDVHDYMIAAAESGIATELTVAIRNKAVEAFQEIMRMQA